MKKEYLLLLLFAGAAVYIATRKRKTKGLVTVESPTKVSKEKFESKEPSDISDLKALAGINLF